MLAKNAESEKAREAEARLQVTASLGAWYMMDFAPDPIDARQCDRMCGAYRAVCDGLLVRRREENMMYSMTATLLPATFTCPSPPRLLPGMGLD